jgi:hypothetical protein
MPVLLIHGTGDPVVPYSRSKSIASRLPDRDLVKLVLLASVSHKLEHPCILETMIEWSARTLDLPGASYDAAIEHLRRGGCRAAAICEGSLVQVAEDKNDVCETGVVTSLDFKMGADEPRFNVEIKGTDKRRRVRPEKLTRCSNIVKI